MKRRLFNAGALVSLLLGAGLTVLWVRSYWRMDGVLALTPSTGFLVASNWGAIRLEVRQRPGRFTRTGVNWESESVIRPLVPRYFRLETGHQGVPGTHRVFLSVPHALLAAAFFPLPACWAWCRLRRSPAVAEHNCPACGYDLRGTLSGDSGGGSECPECGAPVPSDPQSA